MQTREFVIVPVVCPHCGMEAVLTIFAGAIYGCPECERLVRVVQDESGMLQFVPLESDKLPTLGNAMRIVYAFDAFRDNIYPQDAPDFIVSDAAGIHARYDELKLTMSFSEAARIAKAEFINHVFGIHANGEEA